MNWTDEPFFHDPYGLTSLQPGESPAPENATDFAWSCLHQSHRIDPAELYNFRGRDLSPALGRWMSHDPLVYVDDLSLFEHVPTAAGEA